MIGEVSPKLKVKAVFGKIIHYTILYYTILIFSACVMPDGEGGFLSDERVQDIIEKGKIPGAIITIVSPATGDGLTVTYTGSGDFNGATRTLSLSIGQSGIMTVSGGANYTWYINSSPNTGSTLGVSYRAAPFNVPYLDLYIVTVEGEKSGVMYNTDFIINFL